MTRDLVKNSSTTAVALTALLLTGCATMGNVTPQYVEPSQYQGYGCTDLQNEYQRIDADIKHTSTRRSGITTTGVGLGVGIGRGGLFPSINLGLGKRHDRQAEQDKLSRLLGERDAVIQSAHRQACPFARTLTVYHANPSSSANAS